MMHRRNTGVGGVCSVIGKVLNRQAVTARQDRLGPDRPRRSGRCSAGNYLLRRPASRWGNSTSLRLPRAMLFPIQPKPHWTPQSARCASKLRLPPYTLSRDTTESDVVGLFFNGHKVRHSVYDKRTYSPKSLIFQYSRKSTPSVL
jgi:hypothetical protein